MPRLTFRGGHRAAAHRLPSHGRPRGRYRARFAALLGAALIALPAAPATAVAPPAAPGPPVAGAAAPDPAAAPQAHTGAERRPAGDPEPGPEAPDPEWTHDSPAPEWALDTPRPTPDDIGQDELPRSPFTGEPAAPAPVLAVKIDNVRQARAGHTGLGHADIVYASQVEGGLSRLTAVYSAVLPPRIGPVRSVRESDLELLPVFGEPALAYSGARSALLPVVEEAPLHPVSPERHPAAFFRASDRPAPHNLYLRPRAALAAAPRAGLAGDIGFRFGAAPSGGTPTATHTVRYPAAEFTFNWSAEAGRWLVAMDGEAAMDERNRQLTAATVVVQHTTVRPSRFPGTPYTETVGSGSALVLRDGEAHEATWERTDATEGTVFTDRAGDRLNFAPGPVWVVFAPEPEA